MLAGEQVQVEAGLVDAAKPLMDYMMKESIAFISKQKKSSSTSTTTKSDSGKSTEGKALTGAASNTSSTVEQNQHPNTKAFNKKVLNQVIHPLMEIYLKDVPTEVHRIINSANKMVTLTNGGMNATTSNASGGELRDFMCGCTGQDLADFQSPWGAKHLHGVRTLTALHFVIVMLVYLPMPKPMMASSRSAVLRISSFQNLLDAISFCKSMFV